MESNLQKLLLKLTSALNTRQVNFCLIGGFAVALRGEPRLTRDIDIAVAIESDKEVENLISSLRSSGFFLDTLLEHQSSGRISTVRLLNTEQDIGGIYADLLFCSSGIEKETVLHATIEEVFPNIKMKVASIPYLIAMKVLAYEPKLRSRDKDDAIGLIKEASQEEIKTTFELLEKITVNGFNRGKDLKSDFSSFLEDARKFSEKIL